MINYENLKKAKELLKTIPEDSFSMSDFITIITPNLEEVLNPCGSVCCVVGHCVVLDTEYNLKKYISKYHFDYGNWSGVFFGVDISNNLWDFLFSEDWSDVDNTIEAAIKRIDYVLNNRDFAEKLDKDSYYYDITEWYKLYN